jgi:hypothetical protein
LSIKFLNVEQWRYIAPSLLTSAVDAGKEAAGTEWIGSWVEPREDLGIMESLTFSRNISPPSSWLESKPSKKPAGLGSKLSQHLLVSLRLCTWWP